MKKLFIIVFLTSFVNSLPAQTFQSRKHDGRCAQVSIRYESNTLYYHIDEMNENCSDIPVELINLTNIRVVNNKFTIPDDGLNYWLISFEASEPPQMAVRQTAYCVWCHCSGEIPGGYNDCSYNVSGSCYGSCSCCTHIYPCEGGADLRNGVILVQTTNVIME